jgi:D-sedoheptulose 7-phosphate isomerase
MNEIETTINESLNQAFDTAKVFLEKTTQTFVLEAAELISQTFQSGGKLLVCGNGGSLCDAMHIAEEFTGQFRRYRKALPAIALSDPSHITCVGNDMGFDAIFSRGIEALGRAEDCLIVLSTSGNSSNVVEAVKTAKSMDLKVISLLGKQGGKLKGLSDLEFIFEGFGFSDRIQEVHMTLMHIVIEACEKILFENALTQTCR